MKDSEVLEIILSEKSRKRFAEKIILVPGFDCWFWSGSTRGNGYGFFHVGGKTNRRGLGAHRVSWVIENGSMPPDGMDLCHSCDNRLCVNPGHLFIGTRSDNMKDCAKKGRVSTIGKSLQTHCIRGHEFDEKNTRINKLGHRGCIACEAVLQKKYAMRARGQ